MKPRVFIGSSVKSLDVAYEVQENLEHTSEVTVWSQGIFELSKYTLDSLLDALEDFDFGVFVFAPDDVTIMRSEEKKTVRDNVIFELGLFVGRLGKERSFIVVPRGSEEVELPTDLLGITPASFDADRQDGNLNAALGPASNKIGKKIRKFGVFKQVQEIEKGEQEDQEKVVYDENDIKAILASWMGSRPSSDNQRVIHFDQVDRDLKFEKGTTKRYIKEIASKWKYVVEHEGTSTMLFKRAPRQSVRRFRAL